MYYVGIIIGILIYLVSIFTIIHVLNMYQEIKIKNIKNKEVPYNKLEFDFDVIVDKSDLLDKSICNDYINVENIPYIQYFDTVCKFN